MSRTNFSLETHKRICECYLEIKSRGVVPVVRWTRIGDSHPDYCHNGISRYIKQEYALRLLEEQFEENRQKPSKVMDIYPYGIIKQR